MVNLRTGLCSTLAGVLLLASTLPALAQRVGDKAPEFEIELLDDNNRKVSLQDNLGKIIVILFWRTGDSVSIDALVDLNALHEKYRKRGVVFYSHTGDSKERAESIIKSRKIDYSWVVGGLLAERFNVTSYPQVVLIDTHYKIVWKGHPADDLEARLRDQMQKTPPPGADPAAVRARRAEARKLMEQKEWGKAYTLMLDVVDLSADDISSADKELLKRIEEGAGKWLDEVRELVEKQDYQKAARQVAEVLVRFAGKKLQGDRKLLEDAEAERARIEGERDGRTFTRKAMENARGELLNDQALEMERSRQYIEALETYRQVLEKHAETEAARAAEAAIERITSDVEIQAEIRAKRDSEEADRWVDIADRFARVDLPDEARLYYQKVLDTHADTRAAAKARERIAKLPPPDSRKPTETSPAPEVEEDDDDAPEPPDPKLP